MCCYLGSINNILQVIVFKQPQTYLMWLDYKFWFSFFVKFSTATFKLVAEATAKTTRAYFICPSFTGPMIIILVYRKDTEPFRLATLLEGAGLLFKIFECELQTYLKCKRKIQL